MTEIFSFVYRCLKIFTPSLRSFIHLLVSLSSHPSLCLFSLSLHCFLFYFSSHLHSSFLFLFTSSLLSFPISPLVFFSSNLLLFCYPFYFLFFLIFYLFLSSLCFIFVYFLHYYIYCSIFYIFYIFWSPFLTIPLLLFLLLVQIFFFTPFSLPCLPYSSSHYFSFLCLLLICFYLLSFLFFFLFLSSLSSSFTSPFWLLFFFMFFFSSNPCLFCSWPFFIPVLPLFSFTFIQAS